MEIQTAAGWDLNPCVEVHLIVILKGQFTHILSSFTHPCKLYYFLLLNMSQMYQFFFSSMESIGNPNDLVASILLCSAEES